LPLTSSGKIDRLALPPCELAAQAASIDSSPSTPSEQLLAVLWREVLGVPEVSVFDDFFRLGGDSLSATRLLLRVEDEFRIELSMAALVQTPTLARLAARLDSGAKSDGLIALEPRGSLPPFVCVTTTVAGPWCLGALARSLGTDQPFYLVPHLVAGDRNDNAVPGLAELTAAAIRANLPEGPYTIGGYCFGGVVAYETAQLLAASGAEVRMVVLFDSAAPGYPKLLASGLNYLRHFGRMLRGGANGSNTARPSEIGAHASTVGSLLRRKVAARYKPRPAQFPVVQFIAAEEQISTRVLADPRLGWRDLCRGQFHLHHIGGTHGSLFDEECAVRIAGILRPLLARR
jgi:thioesterase domain-containing protein/acyl carrier protein